jgi:hypothetical protein
MRVYNNTIINNSTEIILQDIIEDYRIKENNIILEPLVIKLKLENKQVFVILIL